MKVGLLIVLGLLGQGTDLEPGTEQTRALRRRAAHDRIRARFLRDEEASILQGLRAIERSLEAKRAGVERLTARLERIAVRLTALSEERETATRRLAELRARAGRRAAAMHRLRHTSVARLVARIDDPIEARRMRDRFRFVLRSDAEMRRGAREADRAARRAEAELERERGESKVARATLEAELEDTEMLEEERRALARAVRAEREMAERLARELSAAARKLEAEMSRIRGREPAPEPLPGGFGAQRGRLPWPSVGRVEVAFGKRVDPGSDVVLVSNGLDIRAPESEPVRAVFAGRVAFADWFEGYGRLVVVAHDGGFFTLYGHLASFAVSVGADLQQHQVLGFVGDTGSTKGAYLYFEIRKGAKPVDPLVWLVGAR